MFGSLQIAIIQIIAIITLIGAVWALIEALRYPPQAYVAAGKRTKVFWGSIVGVATLVAFLTLPPPFGFGSGIFSFFTIAALAAVAVFFADVRPALNLVHRPGSGRPKDNRGGW